MKLLVHTMDQTSPDSSSPVFAQIRSQSGEVFASMVNASAGSDPGDWMDACRGASRVVVRCSDPIGSDAMGDAMDDDAARLLASWSQAGWADFDEKLAALDQMCCDAGIELMVRPSCDGMLSDAICTMAWARRAQGLSCTLLLDPMGWLAGSMMRDVDDHLRRFDDLCRDCPKIGAVLIRSVKAGEDGQLEEVSVGEGELDPKLIMARLGGVIGDAQAVVVRDWADLDLLGL